MDINYWIFILIIYLVSQFLKRKRKSAPSDGEKPELPGWLRDLGIPGLQEEEITDFDESYDSEDGNNIPVRGKISEFDYYTEENKPSDYKLEEPSEIPLTQYAPEKSPDLSLRDQLAISDDLKDIEREKRRSGLYKKRIIEKSIIDSLFHPETLRQFIITKEVLSPPRIVRTSRFRRYYL